MIKYVKYEFKNNIEFDVITPHIDYQRIDFYKDEEKLTIFIEEDYKKDIEEIARALNIKFKRNK